mmetsp:Transcript_3912/g.7027  ORF Transcript_3912/g.7027 Transcript_3912/m.7027 type:complete len:254 (+) Transcript_3912:514-1275(+)
MCLIFGSRIFSKEHGLCSRMTRMHQANGSRRFITNTIHCAWRDLQCIGVLSKLSQYRNDGRILNLIVKTDVPGSARRHQVTHLPVKKRPFEVLRKVIEELGRCRRFIRREEEPSLSYIDKVIMDCRRSVGSVFQQLEGFESSTLSRTKPGEETGEERWGRSSAIGNKFNAAIRLISYSRREHIWIEPSIDGVTPLLLVVMLVHVVFIQISFSFMKSQLGIIIHKHSGRHGIPLGIVMRPWLIEHEAIKSTIPP